MAMSATGTAWRSPSHPSTSGPLQSASEPQLQPAHEVSLPPSQSATTSQALGYLWRRQGASFLRPAELPSIYDRTIGGGPVSPKPGTPQPMSLQQLDRRCDEVMHTLLRKNLNPGRAQDTQVRLHLHNQDLQHHSSSVRRPLPQEPTLHSAAGDWAARGKSWHGLEYGHHPINDQASIQSAHSKSLWSRSTPVGFYDTAYQSNFSTTAVADYLGDARRSAKFVHGYEKNGTITRWGLTLTEV